jgi:hypothetical protein
MPQALSANARLRPDLATFAQLDLEMNRRGYIGLALMPLLSVSVATGNYRRIRLASLLAAAGTVTNRQANGGYNEGNYDFDAVSFLTQEYGWQARTDDAEFAFYGEDPMLGEMMATSRCWEVVLNHMEARIIQAIVTATVTASQTNAATATWATVATATPIDDVFNACEAVRARTGIYPNTVAMSRTAFRRCRRTNQVKNEIMALGAGSEANQSRVTAQKLAELFDVERVVVSNAVRNIANVGQNASLASVFPDNQIWVGVTANAEADIQTPSAGRLVHWGGDGSADMGENRVGVVETYRDEARRGDMVRVRNNTAEHVQYLELAQVVTGA